MNTFIRLNKVVILKYLIVFYIICFIGLGFLLYHYIYNSLNQTSTPLGSVSLDSFKYNADACKSVQLTNSQSFIDTVNLYIVGNYTNNSSKTTYPNLYYQIDNNNLVDLGELIPSNSSVANTYALSSISPNSKFSLYIGNNTSSLTKFPDIISTIDSLALCKNSNSSNLPIGTNPSSISSKNKSITSTKTTSSTKVSANSSSTTAVSQIKNNSTSTSSTSNTNTSNSGSNNSSSSGGGTTSNPNNPIPIVVSPTPTISLSASSTNISSGNSSNISWSSTNTTSCSASGAWNGNKNTSGSQSTGLLYSSSTFTLSCLGPGGSTSSNITINVSAPTTCASSLPTTSSDPTYPLSQVENFSGRSLPSVWSDYGNEVQQPSGYVAASHLVLVPGSGTQFQGYPDAISGNVGGVTGASGAVLTYVPSSGGYDVCFSMTQGNWQNVHMVIISWPSDNNWNEGELDFFEGNPQSLQINIHEIGPNPATNVWQGHWPSSLASGIHLISARWDPVHGYRFYLDGALVATAPISSSVTTPTTSHFLSMQMQDMTENGTNSETATVYWTASYGYN